MAVTKTDIKQALADSNNALMAFNAFVGALEEIEVQVCKMNYGRAAELIKHLRNLPAWEVANKIENIRNRLS